MAIVTIPRDSHSRGKEVAEKLAKKLGYECISKEVILETSVPEVMLAGYLQCPFRFWEVYLCKRKISSFIEAALLRQFTKDNIVYHCFAGHFSQEMYLMRSRCV